MSQKHTIEAYNNISYIIYHCSWIARNAWLINMVAGWYGALACTTVLFFVILSSGTWNVVFVVLLKSPDVDAHVFRVAGPWLQEENWRFAMGKRWFHNWKSKKKTLDFLFFKAEHPDSSLMIQVLIPLPIRFIRDRPTGYITGLNTGYITALDMWEECTEAVHSVAPWTRVTSQLWTCVKYVPKQSIP